MTKKLRDVLDNMKRSGSTELICVAECLNTIAENGDESEQDDFLVGCAEEIRDSAQYVIDTMQKNKKRVKTIVACNNCDWTGNEDDFSEESVEGKGRFLPCCPDLGERLDPGSEVPFGDCPACTCFCYIVKPRT